MLNYLSTREFAHISLFGLLFLICFIRSKKLRQSTKQLVKLIFEPKTFLIFDLFALYEALLLLLVTYHKLWDNTYYKDFMFWILLGGYPTLLDNINTTMKSFGRIIWKQFIFSSFVEYLTGLITFNLFVEYILCIFFSFLIILDTYSANKRQPLSIVRFVLGLSGIILIGITIKTGITNFKAYSDIKTIVKMLIPIFFYILSIPYIYGFIVFAKYEELFCIISILERKGQLSQNRKRNALFWCRLNVDRISVFRRLFPINPYFTKQEFKDVCNKSKTIEQLTEQWFLENTGKNELFGPAFYNNNSKEA